MTPGPMDGVLIDMIMDDGLREERYMREFYWRPMKGRTPWSLLWGLLVVYSWGWQIGSRHTGYFVNSKSGGYVGRYYSRDGTPND